MANSKPVHPGQFVQANVIPSGMTVTEAAKLIGVSRPAFSNFLNGQVALSSKMAARLERAFGVDADDLKELQVRFEAEGRIDQMTVAKTTRKFVPPFLEATAIDIEDWAESIEARGLLAVLLRTLVNSTCQDLRMVDFPGRDDAERPGWDGRVESSQGNPWVPEGLSGWEFGTNKRVRDKANREYKKRTEATPSTERQDMTFVFVTPRRWFGKESWLKERLAERQWRNVCVWDASDLEQWLEQSIPAQVWFAGCRNLSYSGVKSLDRCWIEWCADCDPHFSIDAFEEAVSAYGEQVLRHLRNNYGGLLRIVADSRQEGLAFVYSLLAQEEEELRRIRDRIVVFSETGPLTDLAVGSPEFIPVVTSMETEKELAQSGCALSGLAIEHRTASVPESAITLGPLSHRAFVKYFEAKRVEHDSIERLDRESGRSLTVLRRRLSKSKALSTPEWSIDEKKARLMIPMMLAGAWVTNSSADRYLLTELSGGEEYSTLDKHFCRLLDLEDSPVWIEATFRGVVSKLDAFYGVSKFVTENDIDRYLDVAEYTLSERDPALDLSADKRWAAPIYGKVKEVSSPMRKGIAESLVLLSIHGERLFAHQLGQSVEQKISHLVHRLLSPLSLERMISHSSNLSFFAEAAPEVFLATLEQDLTQDERVVGELMRTTGNDLFRQNDRVELLWALEILAWNPIWLGRVVELLALLTQFEPDDNLTNKPSESLLAIFCSWLPQTAAPIQARLTVFENLVRDHPKIAWRIAINQIESGNKLGYFALKPKWRDYAIGFGEKTVREEHQAFVTQCVNSCLEWQAHTRDTLADLVGISDTLNSDQLNRVWKLIREWSKDAEDRDRAWLLERIRVTMCQTEPEGSQSLLDRESNTNTAMLKQEALDGLEPTNLIWKHAWLFSAKWIPRSRVNWHDSKDLSAHEKRIRELRSKAVQDILSEDGHLGLLQLASSGNAAYEVGWFAADSLKDSTEVWHFIKETLGDGEPSCSSNNEKLISGILNRLKAKDMLHMETKVTLEWDAATIVKLLCLAPFCRSIWESTDKLGKEIAREYWTKVLPSWLHHTAEDINFAVARLLNVSRPIAALGFGYPDHFDGVESKYIHKILKDLPSSTEVPYDNIGQYPYAIKQGLIVLSKREALSRYELAQLEFSYLELLRHEQGNTPNLEHEILTNPSQFCLMIASIYKHEDGNGQEEITEEQSRVGMSTFLLLRSIRRIPGYDDSGNLCTDMLTEWVQEVRRVCKLVGRKRKCDYHLGELLSNAPVGDDDIWPCHSVRSILNSVMNEDIQNGLIAGRMGLVDVDVRSIDEGGSKEKKQAEQYQEWSRACQYSHPRVSTVLGVIANYYEDRALRSNNEIAIHRRLGY